MYLAKILGFVLFPALLCASKFSKFVSDFCVLRNLPDVVCIVYSLAYFVSFLIFWLGIFFMIFERKVKKYIHFLGYGIAVVVLLTNCFKGTENPYWTVISSIVCILSIPVWMWIDAHNTKKEEQE